MGNIPQSRSPRKDSSPCSSPSPMVVDTGRTQDEYFGPKVNDLPHGLGTILYSDGDPGERSKYTGNFYQGQRHGHGVLIWRNGSRYDGEWVFDKLCGVGHLLWNTGMEYRGGWLDNKLHGHGVMRWPNGKSYDGDWVRGKRTGVGKFSYPPGDPRERVCYEGQWLEDKRCGQGVMQWANGAVYRGEWLEGKRHGTGTHTFPNGDVYSGSWLLGKRDGYGVRRSPDGAVYEGSWKNDRKHGTGRTTEAWGRITHEINELGTKLPSVPQPVQSLLVLCVEAVAKRHQAAIFPQELRCRVEACQLKRYSVDVRKTSLISTSYWTRPLDP